MRVSMHLHVTVDLSCCIHFFLQRALWNDMFTGRLRSEIPIALVILYIITKVTPNMIFNMRNIAAMQYA
jgi:hypothetical protein